VTDDPARVRPIVLSRRANGVDSDLVRGAAGAAVGDVDTALAFAVRAGADAHSARQTWELLATIAAADVGAARAVEPHLDAIAILREAGLGAADAADRFGVFAAEGGDAPLRAVCVGAGWVLSGVKPWCSLAAALDRALVTAHLEDGSRGLFDVDLRAPGVRVTDAAWVARGLAEIPSVPVQFVDVTATLIGAPGWYLERPGFAWGGIGVAACWYGGAVGIGRAVHDRLGANPEPLLAMHLGTIDEQLESSRRALDEAADLAEAQTDVDVALLAKRVRATVAAACERVLTSAAHALGPAPLALDEVFAKRVADLQLYIRQHHAERDLASLGRAVAAVRSSPW
jgi:alkylation response protein AidB-like acyl-CoA dehydrogenase